MVFSKLGTMMRKWGTSTKAGFKKKFNHDVLVPKDKFQECYCRLKQRYAEEWISRWPEKTNPQKMVYEDLAIAASLLRIQG